MSVLKKNFTFIDLFSGIGGFRIAMQNYSPYSKCLFASEIDNDARKTYELNYGQKPLGDIKQISLNDLNIIIPDVVCGGFPCQTFSKGGQQAGFKDSRGTLFREIIRIIETYESLLEKPKILILENVQNLIHHDNGITWKTIYNEISSLGFNVIKKPLVVSPKDIGIPQLRNRAIILAVRKDIYDGEIELNFEKKIKSINSIESVIQKELTDKEFNDNRLSDNELYMLNCWNDFIKIIPKNKRIIGFPIWSDEFGQTYDISLLPDWKQRIINKNRNLYSEYSVQIDKWLKKWKIKEKFTPTNRKFEWQAGQDIDDIFEGIIQFRTSGIRIKRPTESPALVAMNHRPIYGPKKRYITVIEALKLQSFPENFKFQENQNQIFKQLGNAVNAKVIEKIFSIFIEFIDKKRREKNDRN